MDEKAKAKMMVVIIPIVVTGALFITMGWPTALGGGVSSYWGMRRSFLRKYAR